jgi:hypothetical protein
MKKKLQVGSQADINAAFDGGAVDTSVTYSVPADQQDIITVDANGVVTAVAVGTGTVEIKDAASGDLLRAVVFQVLSAADFAVQSDLDAGVTDLSVETAEVVAAPAYTLISNGTPHGTSGMYLEGPDKAFDGFDGNSATPTLYVSQATFGSTTLAFVGLNFDSPKMVKKLRIQWVTAPDSVSVRTEGWEQPSIYDFTPVYTENAPAGQWVWQEIILPPYTPSTQLVLRPNTYNALPGTYWAANGGVIDRFRVYEIEMFE